LSFRLYLYIFADLLTLMHSRFMRAYEKRFAQIIERIQMDITAEAPSLVLVGTVKIQKVIGCLRWRLTTLVYHYYSST
jgi:hypothetical protein